MSQTLSEKELLEEKLMEINYILREPFRISCPVCYTCYSYGSLPIYCANCDALLVDREGEINFKLYKSRAKWDFDILNLDGFLGSDSNSFKVYSTNISESILPDEVKHYTYLKKKWFNKHSIMCPACGNKFVQQKIEEIENFVICQSCGYVIYEKRLLKRCPEGILSFFSWRTLKEIEAVDFIGSEFDEEEESSSKPSTWRTVEEKEFRIGLLAYKNLKALRKRLKWDQNLHERDGVIYVRDFKKQSLKIMTPEDAKLLKKAKKVKDIISSKEVLEHITPEEVEKIKEQKGKTIVVIPKVYDEYKVDEKFFYSLLSFDKPVTIKELSLLLGVHRTRVISSIKKYKTMFKIGHIGQAKTYFIPDEVKNQPEIQEKWRDPVNVKQLRTLAKENMNLPWKKELLEEDE